MKAVAIGLIVGLITVLISISFAATTVIYEFLMPKLLAGVVIGGIVYFLMMDD